MIKKLKNKLNNDANLKELLSGSAVTFVIKVTGMLIGYLVVLLISRKYGADGVGIYGLTSRILNSLAILGAMGMNISVLRYVGQFAKKNNAPDWLRQLYVHITKLAFPFAVAVGIALYFLAEEIAINLFHNPEYVPALKVSAFALPFFTINLINVEFIRGLKLLKVSEYLRSINRQAVIIILLLLSVFSYGVLDSVYALVVGLLLTFVFSMSFIFYYFRKHKPKPLPNESFTTKELTKTSLPMMTTAVASFVMANAGAFFVEVYLPTDQVGIFNVCLRLASLVSLVLVVINTISAPKFSELFWENKMGELKKIVWQSTKLIFLISLIISVGIIAFSTPLLNMFGAEFTQGTFVLVILIVGQIINAVTGSVSLFLNMTGNQKILRNIILISAAVILLGYYFLVPIYGIKGAAIVFVLGMLCLNVTAVVAVYKKYKIVTFYLPFIKKYH